VYSVDFVEAAIGEIRRLRATTRTQMLDEIEEQLSHEPTLETHRRKLLAGLEPPWESLRPVWQLRVGDWRVFYDVDEDAKSVVVRAVRKKGRKLTEETL
jgi:mRNA-degrading endonuclease RelE of RelBE toxin-antitoxin system